MVQNPGKQLRRAPNQQNPAGNISGNNNRDNKNDSTNDADLASNLTNSFNLLSNKQHENMQRAIEI